MKDFWILIRKTEYDLNKKENKYKENIKYKSFAILSFRSQLSLLSNSSFSLSLRSAEQFYQYLQALWS